jgi:DNA-binding MarR family transcriptional regulator
MCQGNLSSHLAKLESADLVQVDKQFVGKTPRTNVRLTAARRKAIEQYWQQLDDLRAALLHLAPEL